MARPCWRGKNKMTPGEQFPQLKSGRDYAAVCSFLLLLMFCTADHTRSVFGVILKEMCRITESRFERCVLIWPIDLPVIVTS